MKKADKERKNMVLEVISIIQDPTNDFPGKRSGITAALDNVVQEIQKGIQAEAKQGLSTKGETIDLGKKFHILTAAEFKMCAAGSAYFASIDDDINREKVNFTLPQIEDHFYNGIGAFCDGTLGIITVGIAPLLVPFGGSLIQRTDVVTKLQNYRDVESETGDARDNKKSQTSAIHPFVMKAITNLERFVDPIVNTMMEDYPSLFTLYWNGRKIHHFPHGTTIAEGYAYAPDGITGLYNVAINFPLQGLTVKTFLDGSYSIPHFPHGIATPTATLPLYRINTAAPYEIKQGHTISHDFIMQLI